MIFHPTEEIKVDWCGNKEISCHGIVDNKVAGKLYLVDLDAFHKVLNIIRRASSPSAQRSPNSHPSRPFDELRADLQPTLPSYRGGQYPIGAGGNGGQPPGAVSSW